MIIPYQNFTTYNIYSGYVDENDFQLMELMLIRDRAKSNPFYVPKTNEIPLITAQKVDQDEPLLLLVATCHVFE
jgi:hypothetical protein